MGGTTRFMVFPYTMIPEKAYRHLSLLLPEVSLLKVSRPLAVPDWLSQMVSGWPVVNGQDQLETVRLCLKGYQEFSAVHGENSVLASLSLDQMAKAFSESRLHIQTTLKRTQAQVPTDREVALLEAAIFLEMARDLDEKDLEVEAGLARMISLEGEFREILGISEDEAGEDTLAPQTPLIATGTPSLAYMIPKRLESWFRLFLHHPPSTVPVLVTPVAQAHSELMERLRAREGRDAKGAEPTSIPLGSLPTMEDLAVVDFLGLLSDPETSGLLASCWQELERLLGAPREPSRHEAYSHAAEDLRDCLSRCRRELSLSESREVSVTLLLEEALSWRNLWSEFAPVGGAESAPAWISSDDCVRTLLCDLE